ncbi:FbpB family small basic protein [Siminovitchia sp. 179-K 8D1 HS]
MRKIKVSLSELINKNKEELLKDKAFIEKIDKRIDEKYIDLKK